MAINWRHRRATLYKWWPSKAALVFAMFHERLDQDRAQLPESRAEDAIRARALRPVAELDGLFGKVVVELIAEAQSEAAFLQGFYTRYVAERRAEGIAWIKEAQAAGTLRSIASPELVVDQIYAAIYYRRFCQFDHLTGSMATNSSPRCLIPQSVEAARWRFLEANRARV